MNEEIFNQIKTLERKLHLPEVRADSASLNILLHDDFKEFSRSGQVYNKSDVLNRLTEGKDPINIISEQFQFKVLSGTIILVTYRSYQLNKEIKSHHTLRSSVWVLEHGTWRMIFHQGTLQKKFPNI